MAKKEVSVMEQLKLLLKNLKEGLKLYKKYDKEITAISKFATKYTKAIVTAIVVAGIVYLIALQFGIKLIF